MAWRRSWPVRTVAVATVAYSASIAVSPKVLAKPCRLADADGSVPTPVAELIRSTGVRDAAMAAVLAVAPTGYPMALLTAARAASDGADALWFGRMVPAGQRGKVAGAALGWAAIELAAAALSR